MEAAIRTAYNLITGKELENVEMSMLSAEWKVYAGVRSRSTGRRFKVAVAHGMANVRDVMREIQDARDKGKEPPYHFIEVMACRGGCIAGGGQPYNTNDDVREKSVLPASMQG